MTLSEFKQTFDPYLEKYLNEKITNSANVFEDDFLTHIIRHAAKITLSGGKRVRPYVCSLMFEAAGGQCNEALYEMLVGIEIFHLFCLIQDDVIDRGKKRHDVITLHEETFRNLQLKHREGDLARISDAHAILVGDLFHAWAQECIVSSQFAHENMTQALHYFNEMANDVILGQMIDIDITSRKSVDIALIEKKMAYKTAHYTFIAPMKIGLAFATADRKLIPFCESFGLAIGLAFQIQDDVLELLHVDTHTGKTFFSDITERQHTFLTHYINEHGTAEEKKTLASHWGQPIKSDDVATLKSLFENSGAFHASLVHANHYFDEARTILDNSELSLDTKKVWRDLIDQIAHRTF